MTTAQRIRDDLRVRQLNRLGPGVPLDDRSIRERIADADDRQVRELALRCIDFVAEDLTEGEVK